jgi:hypothetical protein
MDATVGEKRWFYRKSRQSPVRRCIIHPSRSLLRSSASPIQPRAADGPLPIPVAPRLWPVWQRRPLTLRLRAVNLTSLLPQQQPSPLNGIWRLCRRLEPIEWQDWGVDETVTGLRLRSLALLRPKFDQRWAQRSEANYEFNEQIQTNKVKFRRNLQGFI